LKLVVKILEEKEILVAWNNIYAWQFGHSFFLFSKAAFCASLLFATNPIILNSKILSLKAFSKFIFKELLKSSFD